MTIEPIVPFRQELIVMPDTSKIELMVLATKELTYSRFADRLHQACDHAGIVKGRGRAKALGDVMGVTYKGAGKWLNGEGMPDMGNATELAVELGVNFDWLMTGRGHMTAKEPQPQGGERSRHEEAWLDILRQLPPDERRRFLAAVSAVASAMGIETNQKS